MALDYERLSNWTFEEIEVSYTERDSILYALGLGIGSDPLDPQQLRFVYEKELAALPTMAILLGHPGQYLSDPATGVDEYRVLHGEQGLQIHRPLPAAARVRCHNRIDAIVDKGPGRGALIYTTRETRLADTDEPLATSTGTTFCTGEGGFGGPTGPVKPVHLVPERSPDQVVDLPTSPQQALLYRLSGDMNALHADPDIARAVGFDRPILHGLCTYGIAGRALLGALADHRPERLRRLDVRFSAPTLPGDTITTSIWHEGDGHAAFRCSVEARGVTVINNGYCEVDA
jgi:acyl dehydratase